VVLLLGSVKKSLDTCLQLFLKLADDLVRTWVVEVNVLLSIVELGSWIDRADSKSVNRRRFDTLKEVALLASEDAHTIELVQKEHAFCASI